MWNGSEELTESRQHNPPLLMINIMGLWLVDYQRGGMRSSKSTECSRKAITALLLRENK